MSRNRSFSVYLLKGEFNSLDDIEERKILRDRENLTKVDGTKLPDDTELYIVNTEPKKAWWVDYFGIQKNLTQVTKSAVLFILVRPHCFALTLGYGGTKIDDESYHYDFGRIVTLNSVDPGRLKSTEVLEPGTARWRATQVPVESGIMWFDIDHDKALLKKLTGKSKKEYEGVFKQVTGSSQLRIHTSIQPRKLPELCRKLAGLYNSTEYKTKFPELNNIVPIKDPAITRRLDERLVGAIGDQESRLQLAVPGIVDYTNISSFKFSEGKKTPVYPDVRISHFYQHLADKKIDFRRGGGREKLEGLGLYLATEDGFPAKHYSIRKCLVFDTDLDDETYYLSEGEWYRVNKNFVEDLNDYLDRHYEDVGLPEYLGQPEWEYNKEVGRKTSLDVVCLDRTNVSPLGMNPIEPCDLYGFAKDRPIFIHVKVFRGTRELSHLFKQGEISAMLLKSEGSAREKCGRRIRSRSRHPKPPSPPDEYNITRARVVFAIASIKGGGDTSKRMTLFSRIGMRSTIKILNTMGVEVKFCYIREGARS